jgi:hypothetical protein
MAFLKGLFTALGVGDAGHDCQADGMLLPERHSLASGRHRRCFGVIPLVPGFGSQIVPTRYRSRRLYYAQQNPLLYLSPGRAL